MPLSMCGWRVSVDDASDVTGLQVRPNLQHSRSYLGPAIKRWTLREVSMYGGTPLTSLTSEAAPYDTISRHTAPDPMATLPPASEPSLRERFQGCLLAGAIGDALGGAPVEFMSWREIERRFGPNGIRTFASAYGGEGMITDDSQMTLFTAEGLIRAQHRMADRGLANVDAVIHRAYLRWLYTQIGDRRRVPWDSEVGEDISGWLVEQNFLHAQRAPGLTCMDALLSGKTGTPGTPLNDSKGCGGVMRVAPGRLGCLRPF